MATSSVGTHYSSAINAIATGIADNALTDGERQDIEQRLREVGADTAFLNASSPNEVAYLRRMLDTLQKLDNNQSLQQLSNLTSVDISSSMMLVQMGRANLLDDQLRIQLEEMQGRNASIEALNAIKAELQALRAANGDTTTLPANLIDRLAREGITTTADLTDIEVGQLIDQVDVKVGSLGATQAIEQVRTQSLANKRNEAFEMLTNTLSQFQKAKDGILSNMR